MIREYHYVVEPDLAESTIPDWASKLVGTVVRIAVVLHSAEATDLPWATPIDQDTALRAIRIGKYYLEHARVALAGIAEKPIAKDVEILGEYIQLHRVVEISRRDLHQDHRSRFKRAEDLDPALDRLRDLGWLRLETGARRSEAIRVNPQVHVREDAFARVPHHELESAAYAH